METKVAKVTPAPDPKQTEAKPIEPAKSGGKAAAPTAASDPVDVRLVIEMDQATGTYVYKTVNRETGEVVLQLPRAEVLKLRAASQYSAGEVIRTKA